VSLDRTKGTELPGHDSGIKRAVNKGVQAELLGQDTGTGQLGGKTRMAGQDSWYRTAWTGQPGQDSQDRKAGTGELGQGSQKDRQDSTARIIDWTSLTGEPGQNRDDKSGLESDASRAASGKPWTRLLGQDSWHRPAGIGQPGHDSQDRTAGTGQPEKTVRTVNPGQETEDNTSRTGQGNMTTVTGQLAKDICNRTTQIGQLRQVSLDKLASHVSLRGQPGWVSLDRTART
jgi:hypothetical protein